MITYNKYILPILSFSSILFISKDTLKYLNKKNEIKNKCMKETYYNHLFQFPFHL